ncbi:MAG TPA: hypothetical protein DCR97_11325 [Deltaproteobacteria bacterium]|nr:hypothetical protein [Deltaproteobacteria bacterium]
MKSQHLLKIVCACFLWLGVAVSVAPCYGRDMIKGEITDATRERVALSTGDNVTISLGKNQGLVRGDIGNILSRTDGKLMIGRCVVQESRGFSSTCQIIESLREIGRGDIVVFDRVDYRDEALFLTMIDVLDSAVKAYPTHEKVNILIHEIFDAKNNITQLSEKLRGELIYIASQKKRIVAIDGRRFPDFSYYPNEYGTSSQQVKNYLKNNGFDLVLTGTHIVSGNSVELSFQRVSQGDNDRVIVFAPSTTLVADGDTDKIVLPYVKKEKRVESVCLFSYKPRQYVPPKEERAGIIKEEAAADPFKELNLKRAEFNIISPVQFKVTVDGGALNIGENNMGRVNLSNGSHRVRASFRRGYYSGEALIYTSTREYTHDVILELSKGEEIVVEMVADPMPDKGDPLSFKVYRKVERERHALRPIHRLESEKLVETFVE